MTLLTPQDVAMRLQVSRSWVYSAIQRGELPAVHIGRLPRIRESDLAAYIDGLGAVAQ